MLSKAEIRTIEWFIGLFAHSGVIPFDYDSADLRSPLRGTKSGSKLVLSVGSLMVVLAVLGHEVVMLRQYFENDHRPETICMHLLLIGWRLLVILNQVNNLVYREETAELFNEVRMLNRDSDSEIGEMTSEGNEGQNKRHLYLANFMISMSSIGIAWGTTFLFINDKPFFIYATLKSVVDLEGPFWLGMFAFFEAFINSYVSCIGCQLVVLTQYAYMINNKSWLRVACETWPPRATTLHNSYLRLLLIKRATKLYRRLQLINGLYNQCNSRILIPGMKSICVGLSILTTYATLRYAHVMHPLYSIQFTNLASFYVVLVVGFCLTASYFVDLSSKVKRFYLVAATLPHQRHRQLCFKTIRSCKPITFKVGDFYCMERDATILVLHFYLNAVFSLLITF